MPEQNSIRAIICPSCGKMISASAESCMHCGRKNSNLWGLADSIRRIFGGRNSLVPVISTACISLYVLSLLLQPSAIFPSGGSLLFGLGVPDSNVLIKLGMTGAVALDRGQWWTWLTAIYLHGGILHIVFNVLWIRQLGAAVEDLYGVSRSFLIFTIAGVTGFILSTYAGNYFTLGASGSIFGLLGALIYYGRKRGGTFGSAIFRQMGQWAVVLFIFGFLFPGIDNFAHAGGFVGGYLSANLLGFTEMKRENRTHQLLTFGAMGLTVLAFVLAILN